MGSYLSSALASPFAIPEQDPRNQCLAIFHSERNRAARRGEFGHLRSLHEGITRQSSHSTTGCKWAQHQLGDCKTISWQALDGLDVHGLLHLTLKGSTPYRTIINIHGGPFSAFADCWLGYGSYAPWLVPNRYSVFCPNPRGSVGRGAELASTINGDIGVTDAQDLMSRVDHLVEIGLADPNLLRLIGGSCGGYMALWLVTQTTRFAAAVASSPVPDYQLQWLCGDSRQPLLGDEIYTKNCLAERRSPLAHVQHCPTPTLLLAGTGDTCTPPDRAQYLHTALTYLRVQSVCVEYLQ